MVTSVSINSVACNFTYRDSIKESLELLKEGTVNNHPDLKQRWSVATAEDDEGELAITIPKGMVVPSMVCVCGLVSKVPEQSILWILEVLTIFLISLFL